MSGGSIAEISEEAFENVGQEGIPDMGSGLPMDQKPFQMPSREELLAMLDTMGLSDEQADELRAALMDDGTGAVNPGSSWTSEAIILMSFLLLIASVFVFIFYKIYKSTADKETKKEEKRQLKLEKKQKRRKIA